MEPDGWRETSPGKPAGQRISVAIHIYIIKDKIIILKVASILLSHEAIAKATF